jgi:hypothetical protein
VSIHPSDSISQTHPGSQVSQTRSHVSLLPSIETQPAIRPPQYPFEVLWNLEDCRHDADVDVQDSNKSRPSMERAVRRPDGLTISDNEWSAIKASARRIANELSALPVSARQAKMRRTKMFYRTHHAKEWTSAIMCLEAEQPYLKLCSSNWKAEHVLGNSIQAILAKEKNTTRGKKKQKGKGKERERENSNVQVVNNDSTAPGSSGNGGVEVSGTSKLLIIINLQVGTT